MSEDGPEVGYFLNNGRKDLTQLEARQLIGVLYAAAKHPTKPQDDLNEYAIPLYESPVSTKNGDGVTIDEFGLEPPPEDPEELADFHEGIVVMIDQPRCEDPRGNRRPGWNHKQRQADTHCMDEGDRTPKLEHSDLQREAEEFSRWFWGE